MPASSEKKNRLPLTWNIPTELIWTAIGAIFLLSFFLGVKKGIGTSLCLAFSLANTGIAAACWFTSSYYIKRIPYGLVSAPVLLPLFWSFFAVIFPLAYLFGGVTYSPEFQEYYVKAQLWVFLGTLMMCLGLSVFSKRFHTTPLPYLSARGFKNLRIAWWILLGLSTLKWIQVYTMGLFGRAAAYIPEPTPFIWIYDQASFLSSYALLLIPVFIFSGKPTGSPNKRLWKWYQIATAVLLLLLFLKLQYRYLAVAGFLVFAGFCAHRPYKTRQYLLILIAVTLFAFPIINTLRSSEFIVGGKGKEQIEQMLSVKLKPALYAAYFTAEGIEQKNEWQRCGGTFEFTAATMSMIPEHRSYFLGRLLLQDLLLSIPYILYPGKYIHGPILQPETLINIRVRGLGTDTGMSPVIYLWAEGGPTAVLIGMFLFGLIYGWIYWKCILRMNSGLGILLYSFFPLSLMQLEEDWITNLIVPMRLCLVVVAIWWLVNMFSNRRKQS
ncbi:MAG: hypothetical protein ACFFDT_27060 [Candidatus Hodarchaeota archaeon]